MQDLRNASHFGFREKMFIHASERSRTQGISKVIETVWRNSTGMLNKQVLFYFGVFFKTHSYFLT